MHSTADTARGKTSRDDQYKEELKRLAHGRWESILTELGGIDPALLDGKHHSCPRCGGDDRFRAIDIERGALLCNQCFKENCGDGLAALMWLKDKSFPEVCAMLGDYLGVPAPTKRGAKSKKPGTPDPSKLEPIREESWPDLSSLFCAAKPPITPEAVTLYGGSVMRWMNQPSIFWTAVDSAGQAVGYIGRRVDGQDFLACGKLQPRKTHMLAGSKDGWVTPGLERVANAPTIWLTEGVPDALVLGPVLPDGHVAISNICGAGSLPKCVELLRGKSVIVIGDADEPGQRGAEKKCRKLAGIAAEVRAVRLPYDIAETHGKDLRDYFNEQGTIAELLALAEAASAWSPEAETPGDGPDDDRQPIMVGPDEFRVVDDVLAALTKDPAIYSRGGALVQIVHDGDSRDGVQRPSSTPRIVPLQAAAIRERITRYCELQKLVGDGEMASIHPPEWLPKAVLARGHWPGIRPLAGIVTAPILRPDGSILSDDGYDPPTGLYYASRGLSVTVPDHPTRSDAQDAMLDLHDVFADFPFAQSHHLSACMASLLTPFARFAFTGPAPLFAIDANVRGSGKSLETDVKGIIVLGDDLPRMSNPSDDDEARKRITSLAIRGDALVLIDNINTPLGGAALDAALTATRWQDRILGRSEIVDLPLNLVWYATGNNIIFQGDASRRTCPIRFECKEENPENRQGFRHPDLRAHVRQRRGQLIAACLTILRAYHVAGRPVAELPAWGSFEGWSALVRQAVVWTGMADPAAGKIELAERSDVQAIALRQLLECWHEVDPHDEGVTTGGLLDLLARWRDGFPGVREALLELCGGGPDKLPTVRTVGNKFRHVRGRIIGGKALDARPNRKNQQVWRVVDA